MSTLQPRPRRPTLPLTLLLPEQTPQWPPASVWSVRPDPWPRRGTGQAETACPCHLQTRWATARQGQTAVKVSCGEEFVPEHRIPGGGQRELHWQLSLRHLVPLVPAPSTPHTDGCTSRAQWLRQERCSSPPGTRGPGWRQAWVMPGAQPVWEQAGRRSAGWHAHLRPGQQEGCFRLFPPCCRRRGLVVSGKQIRGPGELRAPPEQWAAGWAPLGTQMAVRSYDSCLTLQGTAEKPPRITVRTSPW